MMIMNHRVAGQCPRDWRNAAGCSHAWWSLGGRVVPLVFMQKLGRFWWCRRSGITIGHFIGPAGCAEVVGDRAVRARQDWTGREPSARAASSMLCSSP